MPPFEVPQVPFMEMPAMPVFEMPAMPDMSALMPSPARRQNSNVQSNVGQTGENKNGIVLVYFKFKRMQIRLGKFERTTWRRPVSKTELKRSTGCLTKWMGQQ